MVLIMTILYIMITIAFIPKILDIYDLPGIHLNENEWVRWRVLELLSAFQLNLNLFSNILCDLDLVQLEAR